jgi:hypothetical protein
VKPRLFSGSNFLRPLFRSAIKLLCEFDHMGTDMNSDQISKPIVDGGLAHTAEPDLASQILLLVGQDPARLSLAGTADELFQRATKKQLLDCAQRLGLTGVSKLAREELAGRVQVAFEDIRKVSAPSSTPIDGGGSFAAKFDLGPESDTEPMPQSIPWGYGQDRVTAMVVDPDRLYVYWEVTDDALAAARAALGPAGAGAWLNVRVYDITGRLFDGTNAHSYFDHQIERHDRQWFFGINKPTSTACVEVGLRSNEGYFVKIARSGRVEFPRREPVGGGPVEWLSVRTAQGPVGGAVASGGAAPGGYANGAAGGQGGGGQPGGGAGGGEDWTQFSGFPAPGGARVFGRTWHWQEAGTRWTTELTRTEWSGPVLRSEWEAGPFTYPVEVPSAVEFHDEGEISVRNEGGRVHVVYGPWQVIIRGLGARAERRVLGTWEYRRQVAVTGGVERFGEQLQRLAPGSSEWLLAGASERVWQGASETLFRGASELWLLGASEILLRGASEQMYQGASEYRFRGGSERMLSGASEWRLGGASERALGGASEQLYGGASERKLAGASERMLGASERMLGGASERAGGGYSAEPGTYPEPGQEPKKDK